jgi:hypothetical protein
MPSIINLHLLKVNLILKRILLLGGLKGAGGSFCEILSACALVFSALYPACD